MTLLRQKRLEWAYYVAGIWRRTIRCYRYVSCGFRGLFTGKFSDPDRPCVSHRFLWIERAFFPISYFKAWQIGLKINAKFAEKTRHRREREYNEYVRKYVDPEIDIHFFKRNTNKPTEPIGGW